MRASAAALVFLLALAARAGASPVTYALSYLPAGEVASLAHGHENVTVHDSARSYTDSGAAGPVTLNVHDLKAGGTQPLELLCTDVFDTYVSGGIYRLGRLSDTLHDKVKVGQIEALIGNGLPGAIDKTSSVALQLAVWEVQNELGESGYDVTAGVFTVTGYGGVLDKNTVTKANDDLGKVVSGTWRPDPTKIVYQFEPVGGGPHPDQSFAYVASAPAPEPAAVTLLGLGALAAIVVGRRRRA